MFWVKALQIQCGFSEPNRGLCPVQGALFHPRTASQVGKGKLSGQKGSCPLWKHLLRLEQPPRSLKWEWEHLPIRN